MTMKTYSDEYIDYWGDVYTANDALYKFRDRGVRFEAFLEAPERYIKIIQMTHDIYELAEAKELEIEKLPRGGVRYGRWFQPMAQKRKHRHAHRKHITEQRMHA